jgi:alkyl sulfatase BDS1-like metallo-beta-lactamase superfamily hydrolase
LAHARARHLVRRGEHLVARAGQLALKSSFQADRAYGLDATYELRLADIPFKIAVNRGRFEAERGEAEDSAATITTDPNVIAGIVFGGNRLGKAVEDGDVRIDGSRRAVNALFRGLS